MADKYLWANNAVAQLGTGIDANATSIAVEAGKGALFPSPGVGERFTVTLEDSAAEKIEICYCTARSVDTLTVVRGQEGTTAQAFTAASTSVSNRITAAGLNGILAAFNDTDHGNRGGGALHAAATTGINGFMSSGDKTKLDGIETSATADQTAAEILAALLTVDGAGSLLDADLLDGQEATAFARLATIQTFTAVQTFGTTVNLDATTNVRNSTYGGSALALLAGDTGDVILRPTSAANTFDTGKEFFYNKAAARWEFDETPFVVNDQIWHAGNDGAGSGLDADLLDGLEGSAYVQLAGTQTITGAKTFNDNIIVQDNGGGRLQFNNATWGGRVGRIFAGNSGQFILRPTSSADTDVSSNELRYNNATDLWETAHDFNVGNDLTVTGAATVGGDPVVLVGSTQTITGLKTFTTAPVIDNRLDFHESGTWGGLVGAIISHTNGNLFFRPTSVAGALDNTRDFLYNNTTDRWEIIHDFKVGNNLTVGGTLTQTGNATFAGIADFDNATWGGRVARIITTGTGDFFFRPTSAADTDDNTKDFLFDNTNDRWEFDDDLFIGNDLFMTGNTYLKGTDATPASNNVEGAAYSDPNLQISTDNAFGLIMNARDADSSNEEPLCQWRYRGNAVGTIRVTNVATNYNTSSDANLKENEVNLEDAIDVIALLKDDTIGAKRYNRVEDGSIQDGFISQSLADKLPQVVVRGNDLPIDDPDFEPWSRALGQLEPYLWAICKKQQEKIEDLETRVVTLEAG